MPKSSTARITGAAFLVFVGLPFLGWWWETAPQRDAERIVRSYERSSGKNRVQLYVEFVEGNLAVDQHTRELLRTEELRARLQQWKQRKELTEEQRMLLEAVEAEEKRAEATRRKSGILTDEEVRTLASTLNLFVGRALKLIQAGSKGSKQE